MSIVKKRGRVKSRFIKIVSRSMSNVDSFTLNNKSFSLFFSTDYGRGRGEVAQHQQQKEEKLWVCCKKNRVQLKIIELRRFINLIKNLKLFSARNCTSKSTF